MKGNVVVSDELTVTIPGLGLQPGSGHSCAVELSAAGCTVVHHPRQFGPVTEETPSTCASPKAIWPNDRESPSTITL